MPAEAIPSRPSIPGYGVPKGKKGLLPWNHVDGRRTRLRKHRTPSRRGYRSSRPVIASPSVRDRRIVRAIGVRRKSFDRLIGVQALERGLTLVTRNARDFADVPGLKIENWAD